MGTGCEEHNGLPPWALRLLATHIRADWPRMRTGERKMFPGDTLALAATLTVLHRLACPICGGSLWPTLKCKCGWAGNMDAAGRLHLHREDPSWDACKAQVTAVDKANAWAKMQERTQQLLPAGCQAQDAPKPRSVQLNDAMLQTLQGQVGSVESLVFLELGASTCWAVDYWLEQGAACGVAIDINVDLLPAARKGVVPIVGDGYHLPFLDETFDFVFDCASLHHFKDLTGIVGELHRVLKPGGWYGSQGNPPCPDNEVAGAAERERWYMAEFGLIEHMPTAGDYQTAFQRHFKNGAICTPVEDNRVCLMYRQKANV